MAQTKSLVGRRFFLRAAGINLALPIFDSLSRNVLSSGLAVGATNAAAATNARPARMVCIGNAFGFYPPAFFPQRTGKDYELTTLLEPVAQHRKDFTLYAGLDHGVKGGHFAVHSFLSGVRAIDAKGMPEGNITLDQRAAETVGGATRFPSLTVGSEDGLHGGCMMCWTRSGTRIPPIQGPRELFRKLFINETESDREQTRDRFRLQGSILDAVNGDANALKGRLDKRDREKLDEYFTSVRDVEKGIELRKRWADVPKPKAGMDEPENKGLVSDIPVLYDLIALALQTDSTRIATFEIAGGFEAAALGVRKEYHGLSHHGQVQESIDLLVKLEKYQMEQFSRFLTKLRAIDDGDGNLLKHTTVLFGSGMGNGNAHTNTNLPIILAGGAYKHGEYKMFPQSGPGKTQLSNLFLSMLHKFGLEVNRFGLSTGTLRGLETA
ncbi:MAG: DUF1552 domain-containing protein [Candidatus Solibacter usitatus]|nr:DUF1552 domain-containing protein [Candidatus Solibacter usitatus]